MQQHQLSRVFFVLFSLVGTIIYGQSNTWEIQRVELRDSFLIQEIEKLIISMEQRNEKFAQGLGYIEVSEVLVDADSITRQYYVCPSLMTIRESSIKPQLYTMIKDRPIFIYLRSFGDLIQSKISKRSFKKINRMLDKVLLPAFNAKARDEQGNVVFKMKNFREDYFFTGKGMDFIIRYNVNDFPVVDYNTHYPEQVDSGG